MRINSASPRPSKLTNVVAYATGDGGSALCVSLLSSGAQASPCLWVGVLYRQRDYTTCNNIGNCFWVSGAGNDVICCACVAASCVPGR